jgi:NADPH:quinone reductase-like Zn-dependent oxidoreductase
MSAVAVLTDSARAQNLNNSSLATVDMHGQPVHIAVLRVPAPRFSPASAEHRGKVLVRVRAFSCNYRDQSMIMAAARKTEAAFYVIGSEFSAEVIAVGEDVQDLKPGDRIIPNCAYHGIIQGSPSGIPTNHASAEFQIHSPHRLIRIPDSMDWTTGAAFPIGAQTVYSMVRKIGAVEGTKVLVTAARSNTSLFAISALAAIKSNVYALTSSHDDTDKLLDLGAREVFIVDRSVPNLAMDQRVRETAQQIGGFNAVIDPFFDVYLGKVIPVMAPDSRYVTCGLWEQYSRPSQEASAVAGEMYRMALINAMLNNVQIICNCIGVTEDMQRALRDYDEKRLPVIIDTVCSGLDAGAFLERTYGGHGHFGKIVFQY